MLFLLILFRNTIGKWRDLREIWRSAPFQERDRDSCTVRHPGSADCARRWRRRDAPTWSLSPVSSLPRSLRPSTSARGIKEKDIHRGSRSSRPNGDDPCSSSFHSTRRARWFESSPTKARIFVPAISSISGRWNISGVSLGDVIRVDFEARPDSLFRCVRSTSLSSSWRETHRYLLDPQTRLPADKHESQLSLPLKRLGDGYVIG